MRRSMNPVAGKLIRRWRDELGVSQLALANLADVHQVTIASLETGRNGTGIESLNSIAAALNLTTKQRVQLIEAAGFWLTPRGE